MTLKRRSSPAAEHGLMIDVRIARTPEERGEVARFRYSVYVEEMGLYRTVADHTSRRLAEPEDENALVARGAAMTYDETVEYALTQLQLDSERQRRH